MSSVTPRVAVPDLELRLKSMGGTAGHIEPCIARLGVAVVGQGAGLRLVFEDAIPIAACETDDRAPGPDSCPASHLRRPARLARVGAPLRAGVALTLV